VLARPKFSFSTDEVDALIALVRDQGEQVSAAGAIRGVRSPDPDDQMFLACAQAAGVEFIVTGNKRDFPAPGAGIEVVSAGELLGKITLEM
jgi:uncharacterized protein